MKINVSGQEISLNEIIPVATIVTFVLSLYNTYSLFGYFGFDIIGYLEASEIIFSLSSLLFVTVIVILLALGFFALNAFQKPFEVKSRAAQLIYLMSITLLTSVMGLLPIYLIMKTQQIVFFTEIILFMLLFWMFNWIVLMKPKNFIVTVCAALITIVIFIHLRCWRLYERIVLEQKPLYSVTLVYSDGETTLPSSNELYVTSTNNYIFFWVVDEEELVAVKKDNIATIAMKRIDYNK